ncbi:hypothetical protein [Haladaptatus halobius]|uniref:hypothetical protein n=1 Tax=Haladaptatus halobius TaxID=2884875 RepID=UPI001D0B8A61|nr:hypothetical protein [Haladaptatus halobius]
MDWVVIVVSGSVVDGVLKVVSGSVVDCVMLVVFGSVVDSVRWLVVVCGCRRVVFIVDTFFVVVAVVDI